MSADSTQRYDVFLSHSHQDSDVVVNLAEKLEDEAEFRIWLDKWVLIPGEHFQQEMAKGLELAKVCVVCIGRSTPRGWFKQEIEKALNRQTKDPSFRVIPVILPDGSPDVIDDFLELRTWVDFKNGLDDDSAFHLLVSGIHGRPPGRYQRQTADEQLRINEMSSNLRLIKTLRDEGLIDPEIARDYQRQEINKGISRRWIHE